MSKRDKERAARKLTSTKAKRTYILPAWEGPRLEAAKNYITEQIAMGRSLRSITRVAKFNPRNEEDYVEADIPPWGETPPSMTTVLCWLDTDAQFARIYAKAREQQADAFADDIIDIADNPKLDPNDKKVRVDARKWVASKLKPKKYGEKIEVGGDADNPLSLVVTASASLDTKLARFARALPDPDQNTIEGELTNG